MRLELFRSLEIGLYEVHLVLIATSIDARVTKIAKSFMVKCNFFIF